MRAIVVHAEKDIRIEERNTENPCKGELLVQVDRGGICGSDLHYYHHGGIGTIRLREPMVLGHEIGGRIVKVGDAVSGLESGQRVAVSPSRPCSSCRYCLEGAPQHCLDMRFYGSAMPFPHIQGAFQEFITVSPAQCAVVDDLTAGEAALAEPLAVTLHAAKQAGNLVGKRVLVTGCGPIGLLCAKVARSAGAIEIAATDIADFPLGKAREAGVDHCINSASATDNDSPLSQWHEDKGYFDVLFECSGVAAALAAAVPALRPGSIIVQVGLGGDMTLPLQQMTAKEIELRGSFRFHEEFFSGVAMMQRGQIDVKPLITHTLPLEQAVDAFNLAGDRQQAIKVQLQFGA